MVYLPSFNDLILYVISAHLHSGASSRPHSAEAVSHQAAPFGLLGVSALGRQGLLSWSLFGVSRLDGNEGVATGWE